jgi:hypothetical protein
MSVISENKHLKTIIGATTAFTSLYFIYRLYAEEKKKRATGIPTPKSALPYVGKCTQTCF